MSERKYFGTDGVRGEVGRFPITPDFVMKLGWAAGKVLAKESKGASVLIGKDTRISGYMFESALECGLIAAGLDIKLLGPMPTPGIAYLTRTLRARAGIVISASHNPYQDNGIKFFSAEGTKLPDAVELAIEALMDEPMTTVPSDQLGKASRLTDAAGRYIEFCKSTVPNTLRLNDITMVVDCANGATYDIAPSVFRELGARVIEIGSKPDGININKNVGATAPETLQQQVRHHGADLGIALDGDGDRLIMVDENGREVDGDELLYLIARDYQERDTLHGGVVGTLMSNLGLERALEALGVPFARSKVGDRYVMEMMNQNGWVLGGESSGHIICRNNTSTGDGIIAALQVLCALDRMGARLSDVVRYIQKMPQVMINVRLSGKADPLTDPSVQGALEAIEARLGKKGRVLLRKSGTEPVVRVMIEGEEEDEVGRYARELADVVENVC